jgi:hypothetical protein
MNDDYDRVKMTMNNDQCQCHNDCEVSWALGHHSDSQKDSPRSRHNLKTIRSALGPRNTNILKI